jgi:hypothetical protein
MSSETVACPNPQCGAVMRLPPEMTPGVILRCPRCGLEFPAADVVAPAPPPERRCPSCQAMLAQQAVLCIECGFNLRTGEKLRKAKSTQERDSPADDEEITREDLPAIVQETTNLIDLARRELWRAPRVLGLGDDPDLMTLRAGSPDRCSNPNCGTVMRRRQVLTQVHVSLRGPNLTSQTIIVYLCGECIERFKAEKAGRKGTSLNYLNEARAGLARAVEAFPQDASLQQVLKQLTQAEIECGSPVAQGRKRGYCFVATAAFGSRFDAEVAVLRRFRDRVLARSVLGRCFIRVYETLSPPLAMLIADSAGGRALARCLLRPLVGVCRRVLEKQHPYEPRPSGSGDFAAP